jgi:hypothetical protein
MSYNKLTCRSYKIIKTTIWLLLVVNSSTCKSWNITKHDHRIHQIYHHTHHILWQYHTTNTPCKNKLHAYNLLIACFAWLMGATLKNGSHVEDTDTHQPHVWSRPLWSRSHECGHVKLAWAASIPLYHDIKKYMKRSLHQKHQRPQQHCCVLLV